MLQPSFSLVPGVLLITFALYSKKDQLLIELKKKNNWDYIIPNELQKIKKNGITVTKLQSPSKPFRLDNE